LMPAPADGETGSGHLVIIGKISGIYGVTGQLRIYSYTRPPENILSYSRWLVGREDAWVTMELLAGEKQDSRLIARLAGVNDRDSARPLIGRQIAVYRHQMPALAQGEYYWFDLIRLDVVNQDGKYLGKVTGIRETGANDVLVVEGSRRYLIPVVFGHYILNIDLDGGQIRVDWDPEYS